MKFPVRDRKARRLLETGEPYQGNRLTGALPFCRKRRLALDIGAHIGMWSVQLVEHFTQVVAFEPQSGSFAALAENVADKAVVLHQCALGDEPGLVWLGSIGLAAHVVPTEAPDAELVEVRKLDDIELPPIDFIKIDVEGFETFVLRGGEVTIRRDRPVIVIEQKHETRYGLETNAAVKLLRKWGAVTEWRIKNDYCLRW